MIHDRLASLAGAMGVAVCLLPSVLLGADAAPGFFRSDHGLADPAFGALPASLEAPSAIRWRVPLDPGHSSPIRCQGRIFITSSQSGSHDLTVLALAAESGKLLWQKTITVPKVEATHQIGSPATATPACDGTNLFVFFGSYGLLCFDLDGKPQWEFKAGPFRDEYGAGSSPIVLEGKVILNQDHDIDSFLLAVDARTGRQIWKVPRPDAVRSYSTPVPWNHEGRNELLVAGALELDSYNPADGRKLWWVGGLARIAIPSPVPLGDTIYMASWAPGGDPSRRIELDPWPTALTKWDSNHDGKLGRAEIKDNEVLDRFFRMDLNQDGVLDQSEWERHAAFFRKAKNSLLAIQPHGTGELPDSVVKWKHMRGAPYVTTPVLDHGILYMVKEGGIVTKLDVAEQKLLQEERLPGVGNYFSSPIAGDGKVYFASESGVVSVLASQAEWKLLASHEFHERIYATPAFGTGCIYLRTEKALYCLQAAP